VPCAGAGAESTAAPPLIFRFHPVISISLGKGHLAMAGKAVGEAFCFHPFSGPPLMAIGDILRRPG